MSSCGASYSDISLFDQERVSLGKAQVCFSQETPTQAGLKRAVFCIAYSQNCAPDCAPVSPFQAGPE